MKNWKKGMIAGSIICIAAGFLFIGIGSSMGGWKNIDQINSRYIHFGGSDTLSVCISRKIQKNRLRFCHGKQTVLRMQETTAQAR